MRIERIEGYLVRIPLKKEFRFADAPAQYCESVVLRITGEGASGWSEVTPGANPFLTSEWSGATYLTLRDYVAPIAAELRAVSTAKSLEEAFAHIKGNNHAKAAVEIAWQDLNARLRGEPLWKTLGGEKKPIKLGLTFDRSVEREVFFQELSRATEENFARVTLKMRPGWDVQVLNFARLDSPSWLQLQVDVEGGLDMEAHADTIFRMDDFFLTCVEQPLNPRDFVAHRCGRRSVSTSRSRPLRTRKSRSTSRRASSSASNPVASAGSPTRSISPGTRRRTGSTSIPVSNSARRSHGAPFSRAPPRQVRAIRRTICASANFSNTTLFRNSSRP